MNSKIFPFASIGSQDILKEKKKFYVSIFAKYKEPVPFPESAISSTTSSHNIIQQFFCFSFKLVLLFFKTLPDLQYLNSTRKPKWILVFVIGEVSQQWTWLTASRLSRHLLDMSKMIGQKLLLPSAVAFLALFSLEEKGKKVSLISCNKMLISALNSSLVKLDVWNGP